MEADRLLREVSELLDEFERTRDRSVATQATGKLREVSALMKQMAGQPDSSAQLVALSRKVKAALARMKELNNQQSGDQNSTDASETDVSSQSTDQPTAGELTTPSPSARRTLQPSVPPLCGHLMKQGDKGMIKSWKKRWFQQKLARLYYYKTEADATPVNFIDLKAALPIEPAEGVRFDIVMKPEAGGRVYRLRALSESDVDYWVRGLSQIIATYSDKSRNRTETESVLAMAAAADRLAKEPVRIVESGIVNVDQAEQLRQKLAEQSNASSGGDDAPGSFGEPIRDPVAKADSTTKTMDDATTSEISSPQPASLPSSPPSKPGSYRSSSILSSSPSQLLSSSLAAASNLTAAAASSIADGGNRALVALKLKSGVPDDNGHLDSDRDRAASVRPTTPPQHRSTSTYEPSPNPWTTATSESKNATVSTNPFLDSTAQARPETNDSSSSQPITSGASPMKSQNHNTLSGNDNAEQISELQRLVARERDERLRLERRNLDLQQLQRDRADQLAEAERRLQAMSERLKAAEDQAQSAAASKSLAKQHDDVQGMRATFDRVQQDALAAERESDALKTRVIELHQASKQQSAQIDILSQNLTESRRIANESSRLVSRLTSVLHDHGISYNDASDLDHAMLSRGKKKSAKQKAKESALTVEKMQQSNLALMAHSQFLATEIENVRKESEAMMAVKDDVIRQLQAQLASMKERYQLARSAAIALGKEDLCDRLEEQVDVLHKELFFALGAGAKLQMAIEGASCNLNVADLYEQARLAHVPVKEWPSWLSKQLDGDSTAAVSSPAGEEQILSF